MVADDETSDAERISAPPAGTGVIGAGGIFAALGMALAGFFAAASLIHMAIRDPLHLHADIRSEKLAMLEQWRGQYFSAAFGSSHVHFGFNPGAFDAAMAGTSADSSTVNLAIEGGSQSEQFAMAAEFLRTLETPAAVGARSQPCTVILELSAGANLLDLVHPRAINLYSWETARLISHLVSPAMARKRRFGRTGFAAAAMALHYLNVGMLSNMIFAPPLNESMIEQQTKDDRRGQYVLPYYGFNVARLHRIVDGLPRPAATATAVLTPGNSELIERLARGSPVRHVSFAYVVMPIIDNMGSIARYPDRLIVDGPGGPIEVPIVNLAQPAVYPELYNPEIWYDEAHLDGAGSVLLSRILAQQLTQWYSAHGAPPPCG